MSQKELMLTLLQYWLNYLAVKSKWSLGNQRIAEFKMAARISRMKSLSAEDPLSCPVLISWDPHPDIYGAAKQLQNQLFYI